MKIQQVLISKLRKTRLLKRKHSQDQLQRCIHSLMTYGQYSPLVVSGNEILCGVLVFDAMKRLKMKKAMVVQVGELSEQKKRELRYLDNRTFEMSFWKNDELKIFLMALQKNELQDCGFKEEQVQQMINGFIEQGKQAKKSVMKQLNKQPDTWYCPDCGWTGTLNQKQI